MQLNFQQQLEVVGLLVINEETKIQ